MPKGIRRTCVRYGLLDIAETCKFSISTLNRTGYKIDQIRQFTLTDLVLFILKYSKNPEINELTNKSK